jgi:hypothetical protein
VERELERESAGKESARIKGLSGTVKFAAGSWKIRINF